MRQSEAAARSHIRRGIAGYITGFLLSLLLTMMAYFLVQLHLSTGHIAVTHEKLFALLALFAVTQFVVQAWYFLHLGEEQRPRWNALAFGFMLLVVVLFVGGSLWIMKHLDYHGRDGHQTDTYIIKDEGFGQHHDH